MKNPYEVEGAFNDLSILLGVNCELGEEEFARIRKILSDLSDDSYSQGYKEGYHDGERDSEEHYE